MKSWIYDIEDILRIECKGEQVLARVADYADQLDDTTPLYVNLRVSGGQRWGTAKVKITKSQIIEALPTWYEEQQAAWEEELRVHTDEIWEKMSEQRRRAVHTFAVENGYANEERRSPIEIMIDASVHKIKE